MSRRDRNLSASRSLSRRQRFALAGWVVAAAALFWLAPSPPDSPGPTAEEEAARQRMVDWAVRDADRWSAERGDVVLPWEEARGHLAIVIDDVGRELVWHERLQALRYRLTFSVLPGSIYAPGAQLRLRQDQRRPREIMLHLPMEPSDAAMMKEGPEAREEFLLAEDSDAILAEKVERALARVPAAVGVNNHMGSRLTTDPDAMKTVMRTLAGHEGLFFLDSRTTAETVAESQAREAGLRALSRHVFLDHDASPQAIAEQLERAAGLSEDAPTVAIAHPSRAVVEVLERELPRLARRGVGVYPLSELLYRQRAQFARPSLPVHGR